MKICECCKLFLVFAGVGVFALIETTFFAGALISIWLSIEFSSIYVIGVLLSCLGFFLFPFVYILLCGITVGLSRTRNIDYDDDTNDYYVKTEWESSESSSI